MTSELDDAFVELLDANDECCGTPQFVMIDGKQKRAIIEEITTDEILIMGGTGEKGGFRAKTRQAEFASSPIKGMSIQKLADGKPLTIINVSERNGVEYEITAGDFAIE